MIDNVCGGGGGGAHLADVHGYCSSSAIRRKPQLAIEQTHGNSAGRLAGKRVEKVAVKNAKGHPSACKGGK